MYPFQCINVRGIENHLFRLENDHVCEWNDIYMIILHRDDYKNYKLCIKFD